MTEETETMDKPLDKLTVKELREMAKGHEGVTGISTMKKDELIALLQDAGITAPAAEAAPAETAPAQEAPAKAAPAKKAAAGRPLAMPKIGKLSTKKDYKDALSKLRAARDESKDSASRTDLDKLRRRINRLKKRSRKIQPAG